MKPSLSCQTNDRIEIENIPGINIDRILLNKGKIRRKG
jgi:hypothetical protein